MFKKQKIEYVKKNLHYLLNSRGETRVSLCDRTGLNRTTIYNILDGRVSNVHQSTIQKVSDFFGISYKEIESLDIEEKERIDTVISLEGNMNPCAVPIFVQSECNSLDFLNKKIGMLVSEKKLTFYFGCESNVIGVILEKDIEEKYNAGDLLLVKRGRKGKEKDELIYNSIKNEFFIGSAFLLEGDASLFVGDIIEERYDYGSKI
jgi:transcriptional regulator with XRE-family HTH domain